MYVYLTLLLALTLSACTAHYLPLLPGMPLPPSATGQELYGTVLDLHAQKAITFDALLTAVAQVQVVAVGEEHYHPGIQAFELRLLQALTQRRPQRLALAMEFLERDQQAVVNAYLAGKIDRQALQQRLQASAAFMRLYFPLLRHARQARLPVIAMNVPRRLARQVAKEGLQQTLQRLNKTERTYLPDTFPAIPASYRSYFLEAVAGYHKFKGTQGERFVEASFVKDVTMALALATFLDTHPDYTVLAIAGRFHISYGTAIPFFLTQYAQQTTLRRITTMAVAPDETVDLNKLRVEDIADYLRLFPPAPEGSKART